VAKELLATDKSRGLPLYEEQAAEM